MKLLKDALNAFNHLKSNADDWKNRDTNEANIKKLQKLTRSYSINSTGDVCVGDQIAYVERIWQRVTINSFGKKANVIVDYELIEAQIVKESYGAEKQQHTFTLLLKNGDKKMIKGRNLYAVVVFRKYWKNEDERNKVLNEKHDRGMRARRVKRSRIESNNFA